MVAEPLLHYLLLLGLRPRLGYTWCRRSLHYRVQGGKHTATAQHPHGNVGTRTPSIASVHGSGAAAPATFRRAVLARTASLHVPWNPGLGNHVYAHAPLPPRTAKPRWDQCCCRPRTARDAKGDHGATMVGPILMHFLCMLNAFVCISFCVFMSWDTQPRAASSLATIIRPSLPATTYFGASCAQHNFVCLCHGRHSPEPHACLTTSIRPSLPATTHFGASYA